MRILITGGRGQLAADLVQAFMGHEITALGHQEMDITSLDQIRTVMDTFRPQVLLNTAAYHNVDRCESEPEQSFLVNAAAPQRLAAACHDAGALLVHFTTDYVFGGRKRTPYDESDPVDPVNVYGASKVAGELAIRATSDRHLIVRTTGLYGLAAIRNRRPNFVETMLRLAAEAKPILVVANQVLTPSSTRDVADTVARLVEMDAIGTVHVTNQGQCSWYEFAADEEAPVTRPKCSKCGGKVVYESYPMEEMLVGKCFVCGKIDSYRELTREQSRRLFRRIDQPAVLQKLAS
jgi:dTDP-4-dehydrorhamnose reductase